jgi:hypothetical protein
MITVTYRSPRRVCGRTCSSTPTTVEPGRIGDQHPVVLGEDGGVRGIPRNPERLGYRVTLSPAV